MLLASLAMAAINCDIPDNNDRNINISGMIRFSNSSGPVQAIGKNYVVFAATTKINLVDFPDPPNDENAVDPRDHEDDIRYVALQTGVWSGTEMPYTLSINKKLKTFLALQSTEFTLPMGVKYIKIRAIVYTATEYKDPGVAKTVHGTGDWQGVYGGDWVDSTLANTKVGTKMDAAFFEAIPDEATGFDITLNPVP